MFQNLQKDIQENNNEQWQNKQNESNNVKDEQNLKNRRPTKEILKGLFSIQNIITYLIALMISMVGFKSQNIMLSMSPFAISFLAAMLSNKKTIGISYILTLIGTAISFGTNSLLIYFLTSLVLFALVLIKKPKSQDAQVNEKQKVGIHLILAVLLVQVIPMFFTTFYVYNLLTSIMLTICSYVFYKIFANSLSIFEQIGSKKAFSIEEVMAASLLLAISLCALEDFKIFGYSLYNILSILIVLILGWKNGMVVGATGRNYNRHCNTE